MARAPNSPVFGQST